ncbi:MAG: tyrosine-type recombinase/integrase [Caldilineaceae bacterium]
MPKWALVYQHTQAIRSALAERYSAAIANKHMSALRGVLREAWRLGYMNAEDYQRAVDVKPIKGQKAAQSEKGRHLKKGEFATLLDACLDDTGAGARDAAIIALAYACGLRRAELAALQVEDNVAESQTLVIRRGKGNRERILPVAEGTADALADWLICVDQSQAHRSRRSAMVIT